MKPTYLVVVNFTAGQVMSKTSNWTHPKIDELLKGVFAETDQAKLKPMYSEMMTIFAEQQPYVWLGFFDVCQRLARQHQELQGEPGTVVPRARRGPGLACDA